LLFTQPTPLFLSLFSYLFSPFSLFPSSSSPDPSSSLLSPKEGNQKQNKPFRPLPQGAIVVGAAATSRHCRRRFVSLPPLIRLIAAAAPSRRRRRRFVSSSPPIR
ncbi:hypothetical protein LINPERPRIM_LOCUS20144, partial [Linum perenne]